ncbi:DUF3566 domain-containing protein [Geodermatophilus sabuli]|uniref:DUF3566 domain-containing protein n=1 Tax=Geodermatophilus sabuli TaxID=1564158 RepID=A0A285EET2_9ACTN|nr:DUF3566 domain-containing protein [Geodermatophilus sabuli]MBB3086274.1 hypothetical protein [Geodermatophilus sabuli]SNX97510.1 Transmembrane protein of unknown function [Geodermatophilus sabuli]
MSDRTQGSVRTGSRPGGATTSEGTPTGQQPAADGEGAAAAGPSTPATGTQRVTPADTTVPVAPESPAAGPATPATGPATPATGPATPARTGPATGAVATTAAPASGTGGPSASGGKPGKQKAARGPRRARLQLRHIDTWSALKISLVLSIAMFFIWMVAVGVLYGVLSGLGVFETLNDLFGQLGTASGADGSSEVITPGIVFGGAAVIGAINIVLMTALCTVAAFIYNMCSDLVGGLEVTLSERD